MFQIVLDERKKREIDPTLALLRECMKDADQPCNRDEYTKERLAELLNFFETMSSWYGQMRRLPTGAMIKFVKMGGKLKKILGLTG